MDSSSTVQTGVERRDVVARAARNRLAALLAVHPRELGTLSLDAALAMIDEIDRMLSNQGVTELSEEVTE